MQQNKISPSEDSCSSLWITRSSSDVTAPGKEQFLESHALYTQTSLFQLFIKDIVCLFLDFVQPTYLLVNITIEPQDPDIRRIGICCLEGLLCPSGLLFTHLLSSWLLKTSQLLGVFFPSGLPAVTRWVGVSSVYVQSLGDITGTL